MANRFGRIDPFSQVSMLRRKFEEESKDLQRGRILRRGSQRGRFDKPEKRRLNEIVFEGDGGAIQVTVGDVISIAKDFIENVSTGRSSLSDFDENEQALLQEAIERREQGGDVSDDLLFELGKKGAKQLL